MVSGEPITIKERESMSSRNAKWDKAVSDKTPLNPEDTLAYYENVQLDPTAGLSSRDRARIAGWMSATKNSSNQPDTVELSDGDKRYLARLDKRANALPADNTQFIQPVDYYKLLGDAWDNMYVWFKGNSWPKARPVTTES